MATRPETIYAFLTGKQGDDPPLEVTVFDLRPTWNERAAAWEIPSNGHCLALLDVWLFEQLFGVQLRDEKTLLAFDAKTLVQTEGNEVR